ncbi:glycerol-3-phosphate dehydrogenase/oxidase [Leucobacter albus]|uniref:Glycerol-3-phosphate dehydrogenase n=1 Tax=Leucobacter albus TaxID=272210 RepID=A0ABW3TR29_9MICO
MLDAQPGDLNERSRARALAHLAEHEVDVVVIGGGITGAGVALDAATRGLSVALIEARDLASGTSGFSSKLVHGGLRYLAKGDVALAWESAVEREALMRRIAPHLVHPRAFLVPRFARGSLRRGLGGAGAAARTAATRPGPLDGRLGDALTEVGVRLADVLRAASGLPARYLPRPRRVDARAAKQLAPALRDAGLRGGLVYWDGAVEDDTRLVVALARTAARHGAHVVTGCRAVRASDREVWIDGGPGAHALVRGRTVINATGVWAGEFAPSLSLAPSRGTHLVFPAAVFGHPEAVITAPVPGHFGRYVFVLPQASGLCYLGLTDEPAPGADGHDPGVPEHDIDFLLDIASASLARPLRREDMLGAFSGLRPLVRRRPRSGASAEGTGSPAGADSASASRRHLVLDEPGHPITVTGGKLTVYRQMAEEAVDAALHRMGESPRACPAVTRRVPVLGSPGSWPRGASPQRPERLGRPEAAEAAEAAIARLVRRYGWEAHRVAALATADPGLAEEVAPGAGVTGAEVAFAVLAEGARTIDDVLARRTRLALQPELAAAARARVAELVERFR